MKGNKNELSTMLDIKGFNEEHKGEVELKVGETGDLILRIIEGKENFKEYPIELSLVDPDGNTSVKTLNFTGVTVGQNPSSQLKTVSKNINYLVDSPAIANYTGFTTTTNNISGNIACTDLDGVNSCSYAITLDTPSALPTYTLFPNKAGGAVNFTQLPDGTLLNPGASYKVWTKINSFDASINGNVDTITSKVFTTKLAQVPPIMGTVGSVTVANGGAVNIDVSKSITLTNGDPILSYALIGRLPAGLTFNTTTGILSGSTAVAGIYTFSVTATNNEGVSSPAIFSVTVNAPAISTPTISMVNQIG